jgi:hypothetical protein
MRNYQKLLLDALQQNHWSLDEVLKPENWWAAEIWAISSIQQQHGLRLFVTFIADPATLGRHGLAGIWEIAITREMLASWHGHEPLVSLRPNHRSYPADIKAAMNLLDELRNNTTNAT